MSSTIKEVLLFVAQNDVKFIRLAFCDLFGTQKNISIMPDELEKAFYDGISFDGSNISGFSTIENSDLLLFPDPTTLNVLPWRPQQGRVARFYCDIKNSDKSPYQFDTRSILKSAVKRCEDMGYIAKIGTECEFYLFKTDENGEPSNKCFDYGSYLDVSPLDKGENVRREICLCLEEMGIMPESSHHESGPGQNEIDFKYSDALEAADNFLTFKSVVKAIASRNGLYATFMPKPIENTSGSGLHLNISLSKNGYNIFKSDSSHNEVAENFIAGILDEISQITAITNPIINSYDRFGSFEAPKYISWGYNNRSQLIRIPSAVGEKTRMELRSPDCSVNPYLAFAAILHLGLDGIKKDKKLPPQTNCNLFNADKSLTSKLKVLPDSLDKALVELEDSEFAKYTLGKDIISKYIKLKKNEILECNNFDNKQNYYNLKYFNRI